MNLHDAKPGHPARVFGLAYMFSVISCAALDCVLEPGAGLSGGLQLGLLAGAAFGAVLGAWPG